jgi:hypothetical protein
VTFNLVTGELLDADIVLNLTFVWRTGGDIDVQTVLLHELGHALGLGHSLERSSIMFALYLGVRRALDVIDVDSWCFHTRRILPMPSRPDPQRCLSGSSPRSATSPRAADFSNQGWNSKSATEHQRRCVVRIRDVVGFPNRRGALCGVPPRNVAA